MIELDDRETQYMRTVVESAHKQLLHELNHADSADFKQELRARIALNEAIAAKLGAKVAV